ncbi:MAG: YihY/virulence factor BrkB family protein [Ferruginibacter sp.]|nr:YihY/virulence factor BrkB family protein [Cytophagales bacterium]
MKRFFVNTWSFTKEMFEEWIDDNCSQMAAALSYYTIFSLAPMMIIVISLAGYFFGREAVTGELFNQIRGLIGADGAKAIQTMVENAYRDRSGLIPTLLGIGTLIFSATVTFAALQESLNAIWKVKPNPNNGIKGIIRLVINRLLSFTMVLGIGFFLIISLVVSSLINVLSNYIQRILGDSSLALFNTLELAVSSAILVLLFAVIFKFLPDAKIKWRNVWRASILTTILFSVGKYLISLYIGQSDFTSTYGAAASIIIIILWINYSCWIFFVGAEYAYVFMKRRGEEIEPAEHAIKIKRFERKVEIKSESNKNEKVTGPVKG